MTTRTRSFTWLLTFTLGAVLAACGGGAPPSAPPADASADGADGADAARVAPPTITELWFGGEKAVVSRDGWGTPHVFADTNRALFAAYGWAVAEDRLFQLELNRRAARGTLAALFGPDYLPADEYQRTVGYTDAELDGIYASLSEEERGIYDAYGEGVNRYLTDVVDRVPGKVPVEFLLLGALPAPWTARDSIAFGAFMVRRFGEIGGSELHNQALLDALVAAHGPAEGAGMFDDLRWLDDPDAPVTVPERAFGPVQKPWHRLQPVAPRGHELAEAKELWAGLGVPVKLGSYAWVVSARRSALGAPLLYGGPQMGASVPEVLHEVQLAGGRGFFVKGMAFAGAPAVLIGRNDRLAWTSTTATGDNVDVYAETLCDAGGGPATGTVYKGGCAPLEARVEHIEVRGAAAVDLPVLRSVHGPLVATAGGVAFAEKRAHWLRELETGTAFYGFARAKDLAGFEAAVKKVVTSHNFLYADRQGNIAYWQAGQVPVRPAGFDRRLVLPGDGSAEWPGGLVPMPRSVNPPRGWLANWNNKPSRGYPSSDEAVFGKQGRLLEIIQRLADDRAVTLDEMRDLPRDIGRVRANGRDARFLRPYLLAALDAVPPAQPAAAAARAVVQGWSENVVADAVTSTTVEPGQVIFDAWLAAALQAVFADELGTPLPGEVSANVLLHVLDHASGAGSGVPPSRDYLNGAPWQAVLSAAFDQAVAALAAAQGSDPAAWTAPRPQTVYRHPLLGTVAAIPQSNRATYAQIVVLGRPHLSGWSIFSGGQSGFVGATAAAPGYALDPHFMDQLPVYAAFQYKPQVLHHSPSLRDDGK